jgi:hypothetical protein
MRQDEDDVSAGGVADPPLEPAPGDPPAPEPATPAAVPPVVVPRWIQAVVLPRALLGAYLMLRAVGPVPGSSSSPGSWRCC